MSAKCRNVNASTTDERIHFYLNYYSVGYYDISMSLEGFCLLKKH